MARRTVDSPKHRMKNAVATFSLFKHPPAGRRSHRHRGSANIRSLSLLIAALALSSGAIAAPLSGVPLAASPTIVATGGVSNLTFNSAVLHGSINPRGEATNFAFQYGPSRHYGAQTPLAAAGNGTKPVRVSQVVAGLQANTVYHYRLVAFGASTTTGQDRSFTTPKIPLSLAIAGVPNPVTFGSSFAQSWATSPAQTAVDVRSC